MSTPRWALVVTSVLAGSLAACSAEPSSPPELLTDDTVLHQGEVRIPPPRRGRCAFDYRAALSLVSVRGGTAWTTDVPWVPDATWVTQSAASADGPGPVVVDGAVLQPTSGGLVAVDAGSGDPLWHRDGDLRVSVLAPDGDAVVAFGGGGAAAVGARDGDVTWTHATTTVHTSGGVASSPRDGGVPVLVVSDGAALTGLDARSGDVVWRTETGAEAATVTPSQDGRTVYVVASQVVDAYAVATGERVWRWHSDDDALVTRPAAQAGGVVLVAVESWAGADGTEQVDPGADQLVALDADDGRVLWRVPSVAGPVDQVVVTPSSVVTWTPDGLVRAHRAASGEVMWEATAVAPQANGVRLVVDDGVLLVTPTVAASAMAESGGAPGVVEALDLATGERRFATTLDGTTFSAAAVGDGLVLVGAGMGGDTSAVDAPDDGRLHALDRRTGELRWTAVLRDPVHEPPVVTQDGVLVTSSDGSVFCD